MTTKPYPESNPHPEKGPLWVQFDRDHGDKQPHTLWVPDEVEGQPGRWWITDAEAIAIARQLGQVIPPPHTKRVRWQDAIGERLPDGQEITGASWSVLKVRAVVRCGAVWMYHVPVDADGMVEVLA